MKLKFCVSIINTRELEILHGMIRTPPPPQTTPTFEKTKSEQGNRGYIGYIFPLSLSTIGRNHLPFNQYVKGHFSILLCNVENSIKREMK